MPDKFIDYARYAFSPTTLPSSTEDGKNGARGYGDVVLGLDEVGRVVRDAAAELGRRGLTTPHLFSAAAPDLSATKTQRFISCYLTSLTDPFDTQHAVNLKVGSPHELAWFLRWALARMVRVVRVEQPILQKGHAVGSGKGKEKGRVVKLVKEYERRGIIDMREYVMWREKERATGYNPTSIQEFLALFPDQLASLLRAILDLLSRFVRYSASSGLTPRTLASIFGPLLFGLVPLDYTLSNNGTMESSHAGTASEGTGVGTFEETHEAFMHARRAMEHLILAYVRAQYAAHDRLKGDFPRTLGVWITDYPHCLAHTTAVATLTANATTTSTTDTPTTRPTSDAKGKIKVTILHRTVRSYSSDLLTSHTEWVDDRWATWRALGPVPQMTAAHCLKLGIRTAGAGKPGVGRQGIGAGGDTVVGRTGESKEDGGWCAFEDMGFSEGEFAERLRFDLGEGAKREVTSKRDTILWTDFAGPEGGFDRAPAALHDSLALGQPVLDQHLAHWPAEREALRRKLADGQKGLPAFEEEGVKVEEVWADADFVDCWADLLVGAGWMEEGELTYRRANWVMVEYENVKGGTTMFVFEERVPSSYQTALRTPPKKRTIFPRLSRHSEPADARREEEIDARLKRHQSTRVVSTGRVQTWEIGKPLPASPVAPTHTPPRTYKSANASPQQHQPEASPRSDGSPRGARFLDRVGMASAGRRESTDALEEGTKLMTRAPCPTRVHDSFKAGESGRWISDFNGMRVSSQPVASSGPRRASDSSGFRVMSRSASASPKGQLATTVQPRPQHLAFLKLSNACPDAFDSRSPISPMGYHVATKPSALPPPSRAQVIRHRPGSIDVTHHASPVQTELEYLQPSPDIFDGSVNHRTSRTRRDDSLSTIDSIYSADPPAPVYLGKPLLLPPRYQDPAPRDTLFSVIDGYTDSPHDSRELEQPLNSTAAGDGPFRRFAPHTGRANAPYSGYHTGAEITFESLDQEDTFSAWDRQAEYSDDTVRDSMLEGDACEEPEYQPPPKLEDIEAIARQSSPGRYGHGIPLEFVDEESEDDGEGTGQRV